MNELVFIEPSKKNPELFTTSEVIAERTGNNYRSVQRIIEKRTKALETFGRVRFQITPIETRGGVQNKKVYLLNEQQATLLITFLKNTEPVVRFKTELVRQFYAMRTELMNRQIQRLERKPIRRAMTDVIAEVDKSKWAHKKYTDLAYKSAIGRNASQLRNDRGAPKKATASDFMSAEEITAVTKRENQVAVLLELGMSYEQVKEVLLNRRIVGALGAHAATKDAS